MSMISSEHDNLEAAIIKTLVWFDLFNQVLTIGEIRKYLNLPASYFQVASALDRLRDKTDSRYGFFFLSGRSDLAERRLKQYNYFKRKIKRARLFARLISFWPSVLGVAVSNIIGDHNLKNEGDIDLLIISSPGRIWRCRFVCALTAKILGWRPNRLTKKDKICLSFYIASDRLDLSSQWLGPDDYYFIHCLAGLSPVYNYRDIWAEFYRSNSFLKECLPNQPDFISPDRVKANNFKWPEFGGRRLEKWFKHFQLKIMPTGLKELAGPSGGVVLRDDIIKLFRFDRRPEFSDLFRRQLKNYLD